MLSSNVNFRGGPDGPVSVVVGPFILTTTLLSLVVSEIQGNFPAGFESVTVKSKNDRILIHTIVIERTASHSDVDVRRHSTAIDAC